MGELKVISTTKHFCLDFFVCFETRQSLDEAILD